MRRRRLATIGSERRAWDERRHGAATQIAMLEARIAEARTERAALDDAPAAFAEKRALADLRKSVTPKPRAVRRPIELAQAETALAEADRDAREALEAMSLAREDAARAEERLRGRQAPP